MLHELYHGRGEYHLLIDPTRRFVWDTHFLAVIRERNFSLCHRSINPKSWDLFEGPNDVWTSN